MATAFVRLLGAVRFVDERGDAVDLPSAAQRRLLAALALANGATLRSEHLCDALA
jgi:DNA-binding SARP family transcriptional activator